MKNHLVFSGTNKGTQVYHSWKAMKSRCYCKTNQCFVHYGGRGISVSSQWISNFPAFRDYMGNPPGNNYTVERIDNDGNYEPGNVRWATRKEQANNTRRNVKYQFNGVLMSISEIAKLSGVRYHFARKHLLSGVSPFDLKSAFSPRKGWKYPQAA